MENYIKVFYSVLSKNTLSNNSPNEYVENWKNFVEECKDGYSYSLYDYDLDLSIRDEIEIILRSEELKMFDEHELFRNRIMMIDQEFISITKDIRIFGLPSFWWKYKIPKFSKQQFSENVKNEFGLDIDVV
jgi:hypothetical protein